MHDLVGSKVIKQSVQNYISTFLMPNLVLISEKCLFVIKNNDKSLGLNRGLISNMEKDQQELFWLASGQEIFTKSRKQQLSLKSELSYKLNKFQLNYQIQFFPINGDTEWDATLCTH